MIRPFYSHQCEIIIDKRSKNVPHVDNSWHKHCVDFSADTSAMETGRWLKAMILFFFRCDSRTSRAHV
jgi:hypothetical protein